MYVKVTSSGSYFQLGTKDNLPAGETKPRTMPLLTSMNPSTVTLADAITMFSLPREVGVYAQTGEKIFATVGRYGAYIAAGAETRSLKDEDHVFTLTVDEATALLDAPKKSRFAKKKRKKG